VERAAIDRVQQQIDDEVRERFPDGAVRQALLLQYGDDPVVEPGELIVRVLIEAAGSPEAYWERLEEWSREHGTRMREFRRELAERLPEVSQLEVTVDDPDVPHDHKPRWFVGGGGWLPRGCGDQGKLDAQVKEHFPDAGVQRVELLHYGDDPAIEPGQLMVRVNIDLNAGAGDWQPSPEAWEQAHRPMMKELQRELAEKMPGAARLDFHFDGHPGGITWRIGGSPSDLAERHHRGDLTPVMARLGPVDLETLDTLISAGIAANRADALRWTLARIRERPAYGRLRDRARELEELKAEF
jgi:hypothetical protein